MSRKWLIMLQHSENRPNCVWFSKIYGPVKIKWKKEKKKKKKTTPTSFINTLSGLNRFRQGIQYISQIKDYSPLSSKPTTQESLKKKVIYKMPENVKT